MRMLRKANAGWESVPDKAPSSLPGWGESGWTANRAARNYFSFARTAAEGGRPGEGSGCAGTRHLSLPTLFTIQAGWMGSTRGASSQSLGSTSFPKRRGTNRGGFVLVLFVILFIGLMGLAAPGDRPGFRAAHPAPDANRRRFRGAGRPALARRAAGAGPPTGMACRSQFPERSGRFRIGYVDNAATRYGPPLGSQPGGCGRAG